VESLPLRLQTDGYQCGVWSDWFRARFGEYVSSNRCGTQALRAFLLQGQSELVDLNAQSSNLARREGGQANAHFIKARRSAMRMLLRSAAQRDELPQATSRLFYLQWQRR